MSKVRRRSSRQRSKNQNLAGRRRHSVGERLEQRLLLASDWQNFSAPLDVNHDNAISPADVLSVVNSLNESGARALPELSEAEGGGTRPLSVDVNGDGNLSPGDALAIVNFLNAEGEDGPVVQYRIGIYDATGTNEIETVGLGEEFIVRVFVTDIRMSGRAGVFSAYLDVNYEAELASVVENAFTQLDLNTFEMVAVTIMDNQDDYGNGPNGDFSTGGLIDAVGSFSGSTRPLGPTEKELVKMKFRADKEGTVMFVGSPTTEAEGDPDQSPTRDTGLYNSDNPVCPSAAVDNATGLDLCRGEMTFVQDSITIVSDIVAVNDSLTVVEDSGASAAFDVLTNDVVNIGSINLESSTTPSNGQLTSNNDNTFSYTPNANFYGSDSFTYTINNGQGASSTATVSITVDPINDGPVNTFPGSQLTDEDTDLVLGNGSISVEDVDADAGGGVQVSLSVNNGTLSVGSSPATVTGDGSNSVVIDGLVASVNSALSTVNYTPSSDYSGSDTLSITTSDLGNLGAGGALSDVDTVSITINPINDGPVNTVPGPQTAFNTETLSFGAGAFQVSDVDAATLEVQLSVSDGTVFLGTTDGLQLSGNSTSSLTATGTVSAINNGLGSLVYDPTDGFIGSDTLSMTTSDLGGTGAGGVMTDSDSVMLTVTPPETPFAGGDFFTIEEDSLQALSISVTALLGNDIAPMGDNSLSLTQVNGLPITNGGFLTTGNGSLNFDSSAGTFSYRPPADLFGSDTFTYTIVSTPDAGDGPSTATVNIDVQPINDGPINSVGGPYFVDEDNNLNLSGISVQDIDAGDGSVSVTLDVSHGALNLSAGGATVTGSGSGSVSIDGTVSQVNGALGGLTYTPTTNFAGLDSLIVSTSDNGNTGGVSGDPDVANPLTDADTVNITIQPINDPPTLVVPGGQSFITDFDNVFGSTGGNAFSIADVDADSDDVQVDLTIGAGSLTLTQTSGLTTVTGNGTNSIRLLGTVENINAALGAGVDYRVNTSGNLTLNATVNDLGNNGGVPGNPNAANPLSDSGTVNVEVLDFVPSILGGFVFVDLNSDGVRSSNEPGLEGVEIQLSGTDGISGAAIDAVSVYTDNSGKYSISNLRPGLYYIDKINPGQFIDGNDHFESPVTAAGLDRGTIDIDIRGGIDSQSNNFAVQGLNGLFFDGVHLQTPLQAGGEIYNNLLFAIDSSDPLNPPSTVVLYQGDQWAGYTDARVTMAADGQAVTVSMWEVATSTRKSATFTFNSARFRTRAMGTLSTIRVFFTPDMLNGAADATRFAQAVDEVMAIS